jgi:endonuclease-3 related protein
MPVEAVYRALDRAWGPQGWWPARTPLEMMVGAILTQNTAWTNVEKALARLDEAGALAFGPLHQAPLDQLAGWIRPAGYFRVKAKRLRALTRMIDETYDGSVERMLGEEPGRLRRVLLSVHGVGPETADSILLYAAAQPFFVVDAYTRRFLVRHRWAPAKASYDQVAAVFTGGMPPHAARYGQFHALIVRLGKLRCRPRPECASCPLANFLPPGGPCL